MARAEAPRTVFRQVVDGLGSAILRGDYDEGPLPVEAELAASFGVGRNLLREAVKVLASKNLVVVGPKIGTRVLPRSEWNLLDPDVLLWLSESEGAMTHSFDLVEFRLIVEPRAAHLAALRATDAERQHIRAAFDAYSECLTHPELIFDRDFVFHQAIHTASHNALLASIGWRLGTLMRKQVLTTTDYPGAFERGLPLHKELAEAISARDAAWAEDVAFRLVLMPYEDLAGRLDVPEARRLGEVVSPKQSPRAATAAD
ncbi:MAG: FadR family transcriptional regulator [Proteobacteria bacterium]|nr:FadR family transcriptional regulator [Pseudomonadota bacterium]